jgi:hypothetical protein
MQACADSDTFWKATKKNRVKELDEYWNHLDNTRMEAQDTAVSSTNYALLKTGEFRLEDILEKGSGRMEDYFQLDEDATPKLLNEKDGTAFEYPILKHHKLIHNHRYISLPLIQFAEFDGMVHIVYHEDEHHMFFKKDDEGNESINKFNVGNLIKAFSREYEGLILDWDIVDVKGQQYQEGSFNDALQERLYLTKGIGPQVQYNLFSLN